VNPKLITLPRFTTINIPITICNRFKNNGASTPNKKYNTYTSSPYNENFFIGCGLSTPSSI